MGKASYREKKVIGIGPLANAKKRVRGRTLSGYKSGKTEKAPKGLNREQRKRPQ